MKPLAKALVAVTFLAMNAHALSDTQLAALVDQRLAGDRTGACMAVAVIEKDTVARTFRCADATQAQRIGPQQTAGI